MVFGAAEGYDASSNGGATAFSTATDTADITVTAVNDAPVLTPATPSLPTISEDDVGNGGIQISTLLGGSVSDVDTGALQGIAVTGLANGNGAWEYSTDGGLTWIAVGTVSDNSALLLRSIDYIRFVPDGENADTASFDFRAWDQTSGLFGTKVDTSSNGGTTAFSTAIDTADITVTAVNDAPVLTPATPSLPAISEDDVGNGGIQISNTIEQYTQAVNQCRDIFKKKTSDYGTSWRVYRTISIVDQIYIKAKRIRTIQEKQEQKIGDTIASEFKGILNYAVMGLIQLELPPSENDELSVEKVMELYNDKIAKAQLLMLDKNHDYGEAWREMSQESFVDLMLAKLQRIRQILQNDGKTLVSEGIDANYYDIINYAIFGLILIEEGSHKG